jgi:hypothetical protein
MKSISKAWQAAALGFVIATTAAPVFAAEKQTDQRLPDPGLKVTFQPKTGRYCIRSTNEEAAVRTGTRLYRAECRTRRDWAVQGLTIAM